MSNQLEENITDTDFIKKLIPQKDPFVMIDKLLYFDTEKVISGLKVTSDNILTSGDYLTEGGLIENMAQSIALHRGYRGYINRGKDDKPKTGFIGSIKHATINSLPKIGTELITTVEIVAEIMQVSLVQIEVNDPEGNLIASSEMKTIIVDS
ncbi:hypothetical protein J8L88_16085 [Aquimarina sp. MMG015]|uniref:hypothetical protein n=1 Tax=Aquimarina TaxID=290174 RepID=UPI00040FDB36|nr:MULTISPECIES: hypothetical protein [Aquimarina]AXT55611.1 hypothetical protein D1815_07515 [Aquimarina sp. AD1]MBQ4804385.1 hypothetical protein [Aquimarina sp. MMG015]RKN37443.1 hypothetical protein D7035_00430 [Aquimarina sp. AD1]